MWVEPPVFRDFVESFTRNLTAHGIDRVVYVNAHGGNVVHLREVGRRLQQDGTAFAIEWMWNESIPDLIDDAFDVLGPTAGRKRPRWSCTSPGPRPRGPTRGCPRRRATFEHDAERVHGATTFYDTIEHSPNGVFGDQTDATPRSVSSCSRPLRTNSRRYSSGSTNAPRRTPHGLRSRARTRSLTRWNALFCSVSCRRLPANSYISDRL